MMNNNNPWAGLASYEDPSKSKRKLKFCGRDNDIYDVTRLIDDNLLLILYGKSGIGKTSLLNAGVFPKLRLEQYLPVSIRLGTLETKASYQEAIISAIENAIEEVHGNISVYDVVEEQIDNQEPDRLWNYFARHRFANAEQQPLFPVVVLDQFEEVLRNINSEHVGKAQILLNQLQYLLDESHALSDCIVNGKEYFYDFNFRFVISIREDELYLLEDNIDDLSLSMFRNCRYRLRPMKPEQARQVVLVPGESCIKIEDKEAVAVQVVKLAKQNNQNSIDTILLSLICSELYNIANQKQTIITKELIEQLGDNVLGSFYENAMLSVSPITENYLESRLITQSGFRNSIAMEDLLHDGIKKEDLDKLIEKRLLRIEHSDGIERIEFAHDALCSMAKNCREKHRNKHLEDENQRLEKENRRNSIRNNSIGYFFDIITPFLLTILLTITYLTYEKVKGVVGFGIILSLFFIFSTNIILFPYRHIRERNSIWVSLFAFITNGINTLFIFGSIIRPVLLSINDESTLGKDLVYPSILLKFSSIWFYSIAYYLIHFIISCWFKKKRNFRESIKYIISFQIYKEFPLFKWILLGLSLVTILSIIIIAIAI